MEISWLGMISLKKIYFLSIKKIGIISDLIIVIGGDGNMLNAARVLAPYNKRIIGINQGELGFLQDLCFGSKTIHRSLEKVLDGFFFIEKRFFLEVAIKNFQDKYKIRKAVNEVLINSKKVTNMIEYSIFFDGKFAFFDKSDGLVIGTPTGSTAYSLSIGGPIINPLLSVMTVFPVSSHTISSRPLIVKNTCQISIKLKKS